ncbi:MAG: Calx-beta domain-containing protein, partial [Synechococcaceae cyanobacterium]|nr:Calx-beta domain-containing protein [Synechococcaceae cyanobacterium]
TSSLKLDAATDNLPVAPAVSADVTLEAGTDVSTSHSVLSSSQNASCACPFCSRIAVEVEVTDAAAAPAVVQALPATAAGAVAASTLGTLSLEDTFRLHSNPGAAKTIYLDFDGHSMASSVWENYSALSLKPFYSSLTDSAKLEIQRIWQRVTEDYAAFDVNVTTQDPGTERLRNTGGTDTEWGIRMVFTENVNQLTGAAILNAGGGGTAYYNSFNWSNDEPALGFNRGEYAASETASHEVGHSLNLRHDGTTTSGYYGGHGTGTTSWGAIMGAAFIGSLENVTTWSKGEYNSANNFEDDLSVITTRNGFGYKADDHGNSLATATALTGGSFSSFGTIERNTDLDWFRFETGSGNVSLSLINANRAWVGSGTGDYASQTFSSTLLGTRAPNLDMEARLYSADGSLIAISNPVDGVTAGFNLNLNGGVYYLSVDGVGAGDPFSATPTGYTDYASLGQYLLTGSVQEAVGLQVTPNGSLVTSENGTTASFSVKLSKQPTNTVSVSVTSSNAAEGLPDVSVLSFDSSNWNVAQTVTVTGMNDQVVDGTVGYSILLDTSASLASEFAGLAPTTVDLTNLDNDLPRLSFGPSNLVNAVEGLNGSVSFTLSLDRASSTPVTVTVATVNGSATAGSDFIAFNQTVTFNPGQLQQTVVVNLVNDNLSEADELFQVVLSNVQNALLDTPSSFEVAISDTVSSAMSTTLAAGVENLNLIGSDAISGLGNSGANRINGNDAANILAGGGGLDEIAGKGGVDCFDFSGITTAANATTVTDFVTGEKLLLSETWTSRGSSGAAPAQLGTNAVVTTLNTTSGSRMTLNTNSTTGSDVFLFTPEMTELDVDLAIATNGSELLDGISTASGSVKLSTSTVGGRGYIGAYDNGNFYLFSFNAGTDSSVSASEIQRIGILDSSNPIAAGSLGAANFEMVALSATAR